MTLVATQVKRRRGTTAENNAFTGAEGEITVDLTTHELRVHDGSTVGGHTIPTKNYGYSKAESDDLLSNKANIALDNITNAGKEVCANMAMPSGTISTLSVGASGTTYTAPADGYFVFRGQSNSTFGWFGMVVDEVHRGQIVQINTYSSNSWICGTLPVSKGQVMSLNYGLDGSKVLSFVYAKGAA